MRAPAPGFGLDLGVALDRQQVGLGVEDLPDALAEDAPVVPRDGEMAAEVEEGALADLVRDALGADEAEGEVFLAVAGAGPGATDEHSPKGARGGREVKPLYHFMVLHLRFGDTADREQTTYAP